MKNILPLSEFIHNTYIKHITQLKKKKEIC